jgi:phenylacetic acid degradation operon negative regulatory protein
MAMPSTAPLMLSPLLAALDAHNPIRAGSLIVTVFGDAVQPRGGRLSLASLTAILEPLGINDGQIRTALSRLAADGWFERNRIGRQSFYALTARGQADVKAAALRIYGPFGRAWSGVLHLAVLGEGADEAARMALQKAGFAPIAPRSLIGPDPGPTLPGVTFFEVKPVAPATPQGLAAQAWPVEEIADRYRAFTALFGLWLDPSRLERLNGEQALALRLLLVHDWRRIILRDPALPLALLPEPWPGDEARHVAARLYRSLVPKSETWLDMIASSEEGALPKASIDLSMRFQNPDGVATVKRVP